MENASRDDEAPSTVILPHGFSLSTERLLCRGKWVSDGFEVAAWRPVAGRVIPLPSGVKVSWITPSGHREIVEVGRASAHRGSEIAERLAARGLRIAPDQHAVLREFFALVIAY